MISPLPLLYDISWHKVKLCLQNTRNEYAKAHPLTIFNGLFYTVAGKCAVNHEDFFFHPCGQPFGARVSKNCAYELELVFPLLSRDKIADFLLSLVNYLQDKKKNFKIVGEPQIQKRCLVDLEIEYGEFSDDLEICLDFLTPLPFKEKADRKELIDRDNFAKLFQNRLQRFFNISLPDFVSLWQDIRLLPYYWKFGTHGRQPSKSGPGHQFIQGVTGPIYLRGNITKILPMLLICSEIHTGGKRPNAQGYFLLRRDLSFFAPKIADFALFRDTVAGIEQDGSYNDEIAQTFVDKEVAFADIHHRLQTNSLDLKPATGFMVDKRRDGQRPIATLDLSDYLIHKFLASLLSPVLERMFENSSVGFRKGKSRDTARSMIRQAVSEGFCYVLESDVASFFDRIDWQLLEGKLHEAFPKHDTHIVDLLCQIMRQPLTMYGKEKSRECGLLQGSPLSPMLANLYLDSFDEAMAERGFRLVRYGDDFLVLTRTREEAEQALLAIREILQELKLVICEDKTKTTPVELGFSFLGLSFDAGMDEDFIAEASLKKTLYIRQQYNFVGLDGDSIVIRNKGVLHARFPLARIGEIIVLGSNTISAQLLGRCARQKIPVSFCSPMGYYHSTLQPDSKRHFLLGANHARRHGELEANQVSMLAAQIVTAKIHNYLAWFKERWPSESRDLVHHLETAIASLVKANEVRRIRGYEGDAAKHIFKFVNRLCVDSAFHCKGRQQRKREDPYNSLLDFAYSLLFTRLNVLLRSQGLNPYLGLLHSHKDHFESLVCDLQEPFRCRIDRFVIKTVNRKIISHDDFDLNQYGKLWMNHGAVGRFLEAFEREMATRLAGDDGTMKQLLMAQVRSVKDWAENNGNLVIFQAKSGCNNLAINV